MIKVENPGVGDSARHYDGAVRGMGAHFVWLNHGKESVELSLTAPGDREVFDRLLERADVFVSNLAPGALGRLGLAPDDLVERFPRLVVVDISGYGIGWAVGSQAGLRPAGPVRGRRVLRSPARRGTRRRAGVPVADIGTALYAYSAVLAALYDRERTGRGRSFRWRCSTSSRR